MFRNIFTKAATITLRRKSLEPLPSPLAASGLARRWISSQEEDPTALVDQLELPKVTPLVRRAILYVPGNDQRKIDKALRSWREFDSIVLDLEDGVAVSAKDQARRTILATLDQHCHDQDLWRKLSVRINGADSGRAQDDLQVILSGKYIPRTILVPKVDSKTDIDRFAEYLNKALNVREGGADPPLIDLVTYMESAKAMLDLRDICTHTFEMCGVCNFIFAGIVFGSDDFCASIGATRSDNGGELVLARQHLITVAKSMNLQAIDTVYIDFRDKEGLRRQAEQGAAWGFTGKQAIHPDQCPIIQEAYRPSDERIEWARGLVEEFERAQKDGRGAFEYRGQMIDAPLLKQAYNVLDLAKQIGIPV